MFQQGDNDTCNVSLKFVRKYDVFEGSLTAFKKATALMKKLMNCMVDNGFVSKNMSLGDMSYQDTISIVEQGMEILRESIETFLAHHLSLFIKQLPQRHLINEK